MSWLRSLSPRRWLVAAGLFVAAVFAVLAGRRSMKAGTRHAENAANARLDADEAHGRAIKAAGRAMDTRAKAQARIDELRGRGHVSMADKLERLNAISK